MKKVKHEVSNRWMEGHVDKREKTLERKFKKRGKIRSSKNEIQYWVIKRKKPRK